MSRDRDLIAVVGAEQVTDKAEDASVSMFGRVGFAPTNMYSRSAMLADWRHDTCVRRRAAVSVPQQLRALRANPVLATPLPFWLRASYTGRKYRLLPILTMKSAAGCFKLSHVRDTAADARPTPPTSSHSSTQARRELLSFVAHPC